VAPAAIAGRELLAGRFWAPIFGRCARKPGACRAPTGCVHTGAGPECGGVAHSGPRRKCGPAIIGAPILGPHFWPVRAQIGRVQGAHRVRARRCRAGMGGCGPQWPPPQMRAGDYWRANSGPPFSSRSRPNRARAGRPQGACTQVPGRNVGVWPTVAPAAIAGRELLAGRFWAPIFGRCARKPGACRAPTGCVHTGAGPECGGVAHSGPRRKCGPAIIGAPILGPHFWPVRAQIGRVQGAHRVRARRCRAGMGGCGPQWPPPQMRAGDYWRANSGPPFSSRARPNRARAGRPQGACTQVPGRNGGVWPTVAPAANAGRRLLARQFWAPIFGRCAPKPDACRAPTGCVHAGAGPECGGVAHSGPRCNCGPRIIGRPILGPHFRPVRAQTGRVQGAHRVRARRCSRMVCFT